MLSTLLATVVLPALLPAVIDGVKTGINYVTGGKAAAPQSFDQLVTWEKLQLERLEMLAKLDTPASGISRWVADLRAGTRYIAVFVILFMYAGLALVQSFSDMVIQPSVMETFSMLGTSAVFFLFGDRVRLPLYKKN